MTKAYAKSRAVLAALESEANGLNSLLNEAAPAADNPLVSHNLFTT